MKTKLLKSISLLLFSILLFGSCTMQKRRYSSGYHVDWHVNLASKKAKRSESDATLVKNELLSSSVEIIDVVDTISKDFPLSKFDSIPNLRTKDKVLNNQTSSGLLTSSNTIANSSSKLTSGISKPIRNFKLIKNTSSKFSAHFSAVSNQTSPSNEREKHLLGMWSFMLALIAWLLLFISVVIAFWGGFGFLLAIFLLMAILSAITSLVLGIMAISSPDNTSDLIFGILGIVIIILLILFVLLV